MPEQTSLDYLAASTPQLIRVSGSDVTLQLIKDLLEKAISLPQEECCQAEPLKEDNGGQQVTSPKKHQKTGRQRQSRLSNLHSHEVILSLPVPGSQSVLPQLTSPGKELYLQFIESYDNVANFLRHRPQALQIGFTVSCNDVILADIQRYESTGVVHQRGPFALLALWMLYDQSKCLVSQFVDQNFPGKWQTLSHAVTDGRKLKVIVNHGGQGMIPFMAHYFIKWRSLSDEELRTFIDHCKEDKRFGALIKSFEVQIDNYQAAYNLSLSRSDLQTCQPSHDEDSAGREPLNLLASAAEAQYSERLNQG